MQAWWNVVISWLPLLIIVGFWVYFMRKTKASRYGALTERSFQHMERVEALLERIATSLDQRGAGEPSGSPAAADRSEGTAPSTARG